MILRQCLELCRPTEPPEACTRYCGLMVNVLFSVSWTLFFICKMKILDARHTTDTLGRKLLRATGSQGETWSWIRPNAISVYFKHNQGLVVKGGHFTGILLFTVFLIKISTKDNFTTLSNLCRLANSITTNVNPAQHCVQAQTERRAGFKGYCSPSIWPPWSHGCPQTGS